MNTKPNTVLTICATIIVLALIGAATFLTQHNHGNDVRATAIVLANATISLSSLFGIAYHNRGVTREQTAELEATIPAAVVNGGATPPAGSGTPPVH